LDQNQRLMEHWQKLPRRVQDQVWVHLRHSLHSTLGVSWLARSWGKSGNRVHVVCEKDAVLRGGPLQESRVVSACQPYFKRTHDIKFRNSSEHPSARCAH
jgi:hypothetical protein